MCSSKSSFHHLLTVRLSDSNKKIHQSWGGDEGKTELKAEEAANNDVVVESNATTGGDEWGTAATSADQWGAPAAAVEGEPAEGAAPVESAEKDAGGRQRREREPEEEDNTLTFDQYLAQKKETSVIPKLEATRQANEGADANIWKDVVPLQKEEEDAYFVGKVHFTASF